MNKKINKYNFFAIVSRVVYAKYLDLMLQVNESENEYN